jgi:hypothetical protein
MEFDPVGGIITFAIGLGIAVVLAGLMYLLGRRTGDADSAQATARRFFYAVAVIAGMVGLARVFDDTIIEEGLSSMLVGLINAIPGLVLALLVISLGAMAAGAVRTMVHRVLERLQPSVADTVATLTYAAILTLVLLTAAGQLGMDTDLLESILIVVLAAVLLAFAIGLGLAMRPLLTALVAARHVQRTVARGDRLKLDGWDGTVARLGASSVRLEGTDGTFREIPNQWFLDQPVTGETIGGGTDDLEGPATPETSQPS